ncbi:MAG: cysteine desulfurase-like protein [candidate division KSB1 bacterium]|nr:cysteine desulfurase-like protein [candidate division KSB1 bacterium]MDZ7273703.1 cysteine desulfurase-like protein [candidate division KSB1 bacterium]MDZ7285859.1 cysteine desulfurase-like protein [candidate division KSB1 bacterium]MDZ7298891.1 cysteine desulfurase-like protein [candidate division KSB1 bacterium]MDZ7309078.1 cysteine desulfurase-like protein [candidate division KSB1 bacterium]
MNAFLAARSLFPALQLRDTAGRPAIYFDGPGGTQVPQSVIAAMAEHFVHKYANTHGAFATSRATDETILAARTALADFLNAPSPENIAFGANMTSLTFHVSRSLGRMFKPGDEILLTRLDHDANVAPWLALAEQGVTIKFLDFHPEDCTLADEQLEALLSPRTRLVAVGYASNAVGTINDVARIIARAHAAGAMVYVDAVHFAPHGPIDVQALDCDFLACSVYKFFGPHVGVLYGKFEAMERLPAYKVRPQEPTPPYKFETGTLNHEGLAGTVAAIEYLAQLGRQTGATAEAARWQGRRRDLKAAMIAVQQYERRLAQKLITGLLAIPGVRVFGITDPARYSQRTPTVALRLEKHPPRAAAERLGAENIYVWDGDFYAFEVIKRLGFENSGGVVRIGLVHYNTEEEIDRLLAVLQDLA